MKKRPNWFVTSVFYAVIAFLYLPLLYLIVQTFLINPNDLTGGFTTRWIVRLFETGALWEPLRNSLIIGVASATLAVTVGTAGAVGLTRIAALLPVSLQTLI